MKVGGGEGRGVGVVRSEVGGVRRGGEGRKVW